MTHGLIRWWPNLFNARDEVTGLEGVVMGVLPPAPSAGTDATEFGLHTGWVQLRPALTNRTFTLAFWMQRRPDRWVSAPVVLEQFDGVTRWAFRRLDSDAHRFAVVTDDIDPPEREEYVTLPDEAWHHVALACRADATVALWLDGARKVNGRVRHTLAPASEWLRAGNTVKGDEPWFGGLRDLCAYDRVLGDEEIRALHAAGLPERPARNTAARRAAAAVTNLLAWSTNVVPVSEPELIQRRYTTEEGLAGNIVQTVLQASNGYLWVGAEEGLSRFDGRKFDVFTADNTPALRDAGQDVMSLSEAADGTIWIGLYGGLARVRHGAFTAFTNGLSERFILQVEPADDESVWLAGLRLDSRDRGPCRLRRFRPASGVTEAEVIVPGHARRLVAVTNGVWIATEKPELLLFWDGHAAAPAVAAIVANGPASLSLGGAALPAGAQGRGWVNPRNPLERWAEIELGAGGPVFHWLWPRELSRPVAARWSGAAGPERWIAGSAGLALRRGDGLAPTALASRGAALDIACACANREGGVWFGTEQDGLHFAQERLVRVFTTRDGLGADEVRTVAVGPTGQLWAGINRWREGRWETPGADWVRCVAESPRGELWVGFQQTGLRSLQRLGLTAWPRAERHALDLPDLPWGDPNSLHFTADGTLWVACQRGLTWVKPPCQAGGPGELGKDFGRFATGRELPPTAVQGILEDRDGSVWAGTTGGGLIHVVGQGVEIFTKRDGLAGDYCVPALADAGGALWIVSDGGLTRRKAGRWQSIRPADGLPLDLFNDLVEDDFGHFWLPGKRGIHRLDRRELEAFLDGRASRVHSVTLGVRDGLLTPECSSEHHPGAAKTPDGRIWVATRHGVAMIEPRRVRQNLQPPPTLLERLVVNRREFPLAPASDRADKADRGRQPLRLPPGSGRQLEFHYTSISFAAPERVRFRHRLEGYDADWSAETDSRLAFYTNLRPGAYRFQVKAANDHRIWNESPTTLSLVIAPFFWETTAFWAGLAVTLGAIALALHWHRVRTLRRLQELKHAQALTAEKERIAADMHDELGATLTQIVLLGESAKTGPADAPQTRVSLDRISQAARDATARMSDLIWVINPRHDTLENLAAFLREHAARQFEGTRIRARLDVEPMPGDGHVSATFRRNVVLAVKEALHNLLKHSGATEMRLALEVTANALDIRIEDNGRGFDVAARTGAGNGLGNMRQRLADLGGSFEVQSAPGQGTRIRIRAPLPPKAISP